MKTMMRVSKAAACPWISSLMMIDLVSGDRIVIAR
jgi:hypothetical protein